MNKNGIFAGQPVFTQLLSLLDKNHIRQLARQHQSDRYYKKFKTYDHLITMLYAVFQKCTSLREVVTGMQACFLRLNHLGMVYCPRKSTLADANHDRPCEVFGAIYHHFYKKYHHLLPDSRSKPEWFSKLYIIDSTSITLFKEILKSGGGKPGNGKRKGGIKVHALIKADEDVPCLVKINAAATHDVTFIKGLKLPQGSIVVFDKGYVDYNQYDLWTRETVHWVSRLRERAQFKVELENLVEESQSKQGVIADAIVKLGHKDHKNATQARIIKYYDSEKERTFNFVTNNLSFDPLTIALIYKHRWQIELLFKRIKQNFPVQYFLGDNANAIQIQLWCALIADLIIKVIKSRVKRKWSFANLSSMIRIHLMSYTNLQSFLTNPDQHLINNLTLRNKGSTLFG